MISREIQQGNSAGKFSREVLAALKRELADPEALAFHSNGKVQHWLAVEHDCKVPSKMHPPKYTLQNRVVDGLGVDT